MASRTRPLQGLRVPSFLYGTAWKEEATEGRMLEALAAGFRGIDTANQRKHYFEEGVGRALSKAYAEGLVRREDLFLQTKFTFARGQDARLPYDPAAAIERQVEQSFRSSLSHLGTESLDALLLHGPTLNHGLVAADHQAWQAMETLKRAGGVNLIGISNVAPDQLRALLDIARVPPAFVQNRCYARTGWDAEVRTICQSSGIVYQGFSLLTANPQVMKSRVVATIAKAHGILPAQVIFCFSLQLDMLPLTGTTDAKHMKADLAALDILLSADEMSAIADLR